MADQESSWPKIRGYALWAISVALGLLAFFALHSIIATTAAIVIPANPDRPFETASRVRFVELMSLIFLSIGWLVWVFALMDHYTKVSSLRRQLSRFGVMTAIQAGIFILHQLMPTIVRLVL